jgi:hypothetical protein
MALSDEILADLAKKKGGGAGGPPPGKGPPMPDAASAEEGDDSYGSDEEAAMADFEDATTPAEKVSALKAFMAICYPQLSSSKE